VIDYYYDEGSAVQDQWPSLESEDKIRSIHVDVRPALDSFESLAQRIFFFPSRLSESLANGNSSRFSQKRQDSIRDRKEQEREQQREEAKKTMEQIQAKCQARHQELRQCTSDVECEKATLGLNFCMAQIVCPKIAENFISAMNTGEEKTISEAFESMDACLWDFGKKAGTDFRDLE